MCIDPADLLVHVQAGLVGQVQIEENDVRRRGTDPLEPFGAGAGHVDPVSGPGEHLAHELWNQCRVIIDEQQVGHDAFALVSLRRARVPLPARSGIRFAIGVVGRTRSRGI